MQTTHAPIPLLALFPEMKFPTSPGISTETVVHDTSPYAIDEINAYAAIRDDLLAEAEDIPTRAKLASVAVANDFVETCLKPPQSPYRLQHLPEDEATRERNRCNAVKNRIAELRARIPTGYPV